MSRDDSAARARIEAARASDGSAPDGDVPDDLAALLPPPCGVPVVSVLTACHDDGRYLLDALASLRLCADEQIEVIVADDESSDPFTCEVLRRIADEGVTVVPAQDRGPSGARNAALASASARAVLPLDADNLLRPGFVPAAIAVLDADPACAVVHTDAMWFGQEQRRWVAPTPSVPDLLCGNQLDTCAVIRRSAVEAVGGWDPAMWGSEDWALWVALLDDRHGFATLPIVGWDYRIRRGSLRSTLTAEVVRGHLVRLVETHPRIYAEHVVAVIANLAGAQAACEEANCTAEERRLLDRIASLESDLIDHERFSATARRIGAEAAMLVRDAEAKVTLEKERAEMAEVRADAAEHHLTVFQQTKLVQWSAKPRGLYSRLRDRPDRR